MSKSKSVPGYKLHKATGQARTIVNGRHVYLGKYGTAESKEKYARLLAEHSANPTALPPTTTPPEATFTIKELAASYWTFAETYYVKNGKPSDHLHVVRRSLRAIVTLYGLLPASQFGPLRLKAVQQDLIDKGLSRVYINQVCGTIRRMFRWATAQELMPATVFQALTALPGLKAGRTAARETAPIQPIGDEVVDATLPHLSAVVCDLIAFQRLTGCRPGEARLIRPSEVDRTGEVWVYRPATHKTQHHGRERAILIGPKAQAILAPYLLRAGDAYCFSPAESEAKRKAERRSKRKSKVQPSQADRSQAKAKRRPGNRYGRDALNHAIKRACLKAKVEPWSANQLRHSAATSIRKQYGLEAAQVILGHSKADVTQIYAERDMEKATAIMAKMG